MEKTFEEYLQRKHIDAELMVLDDDLPDAFSDWITELDVETWIKYGEEWGKKQVKVARKTIMEEFGGIINDTVVEAQLKFWQKASDFQRGLIENLKERGFFK